MLVITTWILAASTIIFSITSIVIIYFNMKSFRVREKFYYEQQKTLVETIRKNIEEFNILSTNLEILKKELHSYLALQSLGIKYNLAKSYRYIPSRLYLETNDLEKLEDISFSLTRIIENSGFLISDDFPPKRGSWYKKWYLRTRESVTQSEIEKRLKKLERTLELAFPEKLQAEVDETHAGAASKMIESLNNISKAVVQIGSILIIKISKDQIFIKTLSSDEILYIEQNPESLSAPQLLLEKLSKYKKECNESEK